VKPSSTKSLEALLRLLAGRVITLTTSTAGDSHFRLVLAPQQGPSAGWDWARSSGFGDLSGPFPGGSLASRPRKGNRSSRGRDHAGAG